MVQEIHKKVLRKYFDLIISGKKGFEFRKVESDEKYIAGNCNFILHEIDDERNYTGRECRCLITCVLPSEEINNVCGNCIADGFAIIGIRPMQVWQKVKRENGMEVVSL